MAAPRSEIKIGYPFKGIRKPFYDRTGLGLDRGDNEDENLNYLSRAENLNIGPNGELIPRYGIKLIGAGGGVVMNRILGETGPSNFSNPYIVGVSNSVLFGGSNFANNLGSFGTASQDFGVGVSYGVTLYVGTGNGLIATDGNSAGATAYVAGAPGGTAVELHQNRIFVGGYKVTLANMARLYFSNPGDASATGWVGSNFIDIEPGAGEVITALLSLGDRLIIFKAASIYILYTNGSPSNWILRKLTDKIGCSGPQALKAFQGKIYFLDRAGVFVTDGVSVQKLSDSIDYIFRNRPSYPQYGIGLTNNEGLAFLNTKSIIVSIMHDYTASPKQFKTFCYNIELDTWVEYIFVTSGTRSPAVPWSSKTVIDTKGTPVYFGDPGGISGGTAYVLDTTVTTDWGGTPFVCAVQTKTLWFGEKNRPKKIPLIYVDYFGEVTFATRVEKVNQVTTINLTAGVNPEPSPTIRKIYKIPGPGYCRDLQLTFTWNSHATNQPQALYGFSLEHITKSRRMSTAVGI